MFIVVLMWRLNNHNRQLSYGHVSCKAAITHIAHVDGLQQSFSLLLEFQDVKEDSFG